MTKGSGPCKDERIALIDVTSTNGLLMPVRTSVLLQLLAYFTAIVARDERQSAHKLTKRWR